MDPLEARRLIQDIADKYGVTLESMLVGGRLPRQAARARKECFKLLRARDWSYGQITRVFHVDPTTVRHHTVTRGARARYIPSNCEQCSRSFMALRYNKDRLQRFCSPKCSAAWLVQIRMRCDGYKKSPTSNEEYTAGSAQ